MTLPDAPPDAPLVAVLAAGRATRFGGGKLDAECAGKPVGQWVLDAVAAAGLEPGLLVVGPQIPAFAQAANNWTIAINSAPDEGLGSSLAIAAAAAVDRQCALLILLADMPLIAPEHIRSLANSDRAAATRYPSGKPGVPAMLPRSVLGSITGLKGEGGAAQLLRDMPQMLVFDPPAGSIDDIDTAQQLAAAAGMLEQRDFG